MPDPNLSAPHAMELHDRLRAFLLETMGGESPISIAGALTYELASLAASMSTTHEEAVALLRNALATAEVQITAFGVGRPHL